jgi:hypothetical protein
MANALTIRASEIMGDDSIQAALPAAIVIAQSLALNWVLGTVQGPVLDCDSMLGLLQAWDAQREGPMVDLDDRSPSYDHKADFQEVDAGILKAALKAADRLYTKMITTKTRQPSHCN